MGLSEKELEKVPEYLSTTDCYQKIYSWINKYGLKYVNEEVTSKKPLYFLRKLLSYIPDSKNALSKDMDYLFTAIISGPLEGFYHQRDDNEIKIAAYADFALNKKYKGDWKTPQKNHRNSFLYSKEDAIKKEIDDLLGPYQPQHLSVRVGGIGLPGPSFSVYWEKEGKYLRYSNDSKIGISPWIDDWEQFWNELDRINFWDWERYYKTGSYSSKSRKWRINIEYLNKATESSGLNNYSRNGDHEIGEEFGDFCEALLKLCEK